MSSNSIQGIFEAFKKLNVLIIGDAMVDAYSYGRVDRISPEAPVPVIQVDQTENRLGGAANVALNIQSMGAQPILCTVMGDDRNADQFMELMGEQKLPTQGIIRSADRMTTVKHRVLSGSQHLLRIDTEEIKPLCEIDKKSLLSHIDQLIAQSDVVIFVDYDKGVLDPEVISYVIKRATNQGIPTVVDPKRQNFFSYSGCTLFKPNLGELSNGLGRIVTSNQSTLDSAISELTSKIDLNQVLVTLSRNGIYGYDKSESILFPAHKRDISDISGAGDTVVSLAALALALQMSLPFIAEFSNLGGGIVCEYQGVVPINPQRLLSEVLRSSILKRFLAD